MVDEITKKKALQSAIYYLMNEQPFYGAFLQSLSIKYTTLLPTAAITYDPKNISYEILLNADFFCKLPLEQRIAVLHHEVLHFTSKHLFRLPFLDAKEEERKLYNIAGDMAINQYIKNLPPGCVDVKDWKLNDGKPFPTYKSMEEYYDLVKNQQKNNKDKLQNHQDFDIHNWEQLPEEEKERMIQEAKKLVKRSLEKTVYSGSNAPECIKDLLEELEVMSSKLNYKAILKKAIKKTVSCFDRDNTWKRPNKRYGNYSPGTKLGALPRLSIYIDTSGSISHKEANEFLNIMNNFLKVGARDCFLGLWHTNLYYKKRYKLNTPVKQDIFESGGTDVTCALKDIVKSKPDLSIILTDGYYDNSNIKPAGEVIFIISKGGNKDHPLKHIGKTILLDHLI